MDVKACLRIAYNNQNSSICPFPLELPKICNLRLKFAKGYFGFGPLQAYARGSVLSRPPITMACLKKTINDKMSIF